MLNPAQGDNDPVRIAVNAATEICLLPAYPVPDWCDRCASAWSRSVGGVDVAVTIATIDSTGIPHAVELSGATEPSIASIITSDGANRSNDAGFGWVVPSGSAPHRPRSFRVSTTAHFPAWSSTRRGEAWKRAEATDLFVSVMDIPGPGHRNIINEIALKPEAAALATSLSRIMENTLPLLVNRLVLAFGDQPITSAALLTSREQEVLERLVTGKTVREIAQTLDRSPHTVHDHVKSLHRKFNASTRGELVARAMGHVNDAAPGRVQDAVLESVAG